MNEERDFVVFTDDDGNDFELDVIDYFDYNDKEYAVLVDTNDECDCEDEECDCETNVYIMQVVVNEAEDTEEFVSPAEEDMDALIRSFSQGLKKATAAVMTTAAVTSAPMTAPAMTAARATTLPQNAAPAAKPRNKIPAAQINKRKQKASVEHHNIRRRF